MELTSDTGETVQGIRSSDRVVMRSIAELTPYAANARTHSPEQIAQIARSIVEFGFTNPVLVDADGGIIAGHGRVLAAASLDMAEVPTLDVSWLTPAQRRAYVIADNQIALNAGWDEGILQAELKSLDALGFDLPLLGFSDQHLNELLWGTGTPGETDPEEVPPTPAVPVSVLGDVWILGRHRLVCGDSTDALSVDKALAGVAPHLMVTDPPYGVEYDANWRNEAMRADGTPIAGRAVGKVMNDEQSDWRKAWALFPGDVVYCWHADRHASSVQSSLEACGFEIRCQIIWAKSRFAIGRGDYHWQHEPCWYAVRKGKTGHWGGDRTQTTLWEISHQKSETGHSTQKPLECMRRPIENNSSVGQAVYEPFAGSGTTIIAAEMTGRVCHAIELNPGYVDVCVTRWQEYTGEQATHDESGATFDEVRALRGAGNG